MDLRERNQKAARARLDAKGQIDLDIPPSLPQNSIQYEAEPALSLLHEPSDEKQQYDALPEYSLQQCAQDTYLTEAELTRWVQAIHRKGQAIFLWRTGHGQNLCRAKASQPFGWWR